MCGRQWLCTEPDKAVSIGRKGHGGVSFKEKGNIYYLARSKTITGKHLKKPKNKGFYYSCNFKWVMLYLSTKSYELHKPWRAKNLVYKPIRTF